MIVHDLPSVVRLFHQQREESVRRVALLHREVPGAAHERCVVCDDVDGYVGERERAHLFPFTLILFAIAIERRLPAVRHVRAAEERQVRRVPVALHVRFEVAAIPPGDLLVKYLTNRYALVHRCRSCARGEQQRDDDYAFHPFTCFRNSGESSGSNSSRLFAAPYAVSALISLRRTRSFSASSNVCMPSERPICIAE